MGEGLSAGWRISAETVSTFCKNICPALAPVSTWLIKSRDGIRYSPSCSACSVISGWGVNRSFRKVSSS